MLARNRLQVTSKPHPAKKKKKKERKTEIESLRVMTSSEDSVVVNHGTLSTLVAASTHTCEQQIPRVKRWKKAGLMYNSQNRLCFMWILDQSSYLSQLL